MFVPLFKINFLTKSKIIINKIIIINNNYYNNYNKIRKAIWMRLKRPASNSGQFPEQPA